MTVEPRYGENNISLSRFFTHLLYLRFPGQDTRLDQSIYLLINPQLQQTHSNISLHAAKPIPQTVSQNYYDLDNALRRYRGSLLKSLPINQEYKIGQNKKITRAANSFFLNMNKDILRYQDYQVI